MADAIHQEVVVDGRADAIYEILMDSAKHTELTGGKPAEISREEGGSFSCHGGAITGRNIELLENRRIVQAWRAGNWGEGEYSVVRIELAPAAGGTKITLDHTGFPEGTKEMLTEGWNSHYWEPLRELVK
jgi:activator of HSP90 ATPase